MEGPQMEEANSTNPLFVGLFFILRCVVPLAIMLGISYLLKRFGVIAEPPKPPPDWNDGNSNNNTFNPGEGGAAHAKS
jgi:hypothetical protein